MKNLYLALNERVGWPIQPVLCTSKCFIHSDLVGRPTLDSTTIERWHREYPHCNWCITTGESSRLLVVEVVGEQGMNILRKLSGGSMRWMITTRFKCGNTLFLAFRYWGEVIRQLSRNFPGIRIHAGDPILVPPSTADGTPCEFLQITRHLQHAPPWALSERPSEWLAA